MILNIFFVLIGLYIIFGEMSIGFCFYYSIRAIYIHWLNQYLFFIILFSIFWYFTNELYFNLSKWFDAYEWLFSTIWWSYLICIKSYFYISLVIKMGWKFKNIFWVPLRKNEVFTKLLLPLFTPFPDYVFRNLKMRARLLLLDYHIIMLQTSYF